MRFWGKQSKVFKTVLGNILEDGFEAILKLETNVPRVWKQSFSLVSKFLSHKVEAVFWKSKTKCNKTV